MKRVCVYCASSNRSAPLYLNAATDLGRILAKNHFSIIYGGGSRGLMGRVADSALANGGKVIGVMPEFMIDLEWAHPNLTELKIVETMRERKHLMLQDSDAVVALPGGSGTLEELLEAVTQKRLGFYFGPIILVNLNGFYDALLAWFQRAIAENFLNPQHAQIWNIVKNIDEVVPALAQAGSWPRDARSFAAV